MHLSYVEIWKGIDQLAVQKGLSLSAMAQKAGLDPTAFNKSKRVGPDGRKRWLSMESLNKVLAATNTGLDEFIRLTGQDVKPVQPTIPLLGFAQAGKDGYSGGKCPQPFKLGKPANSQCPDTVSLSLLISDIWPYLLPYCRIPSIWAPISG